MGAGISDDDQAGVVADEEREVLVLEHARKGLEDLGFFRLVDMALDLVARAVLQFPHERIEKTQDREVVVSLRDGPGDRLPCGPACVLHQRHRVGDDEGADRDAADDDVFPRLPDDSQVTAHGDIAAHKRADGNCQSDQDAQSCGPLVRFQSVEDVLIAEACAKLETEEQASCKAVRLSKRQDRRQPDAAPKGLVPTERQDRWKAGVLDAIFALCRAVRASGHGDGASTRLRTMLRT